MQETEIASHLESLLDIPDLQIQVVWQEQELLIILNRSNQTPLEYATVNKQIIQELKKLRIKPPEIITFYSRVLGTYDPDWQTTIKVAKKASAPLQPVVLATGISTRLDSTKLEEEIAVGTVVLPEDSSTKFDESSSKTITEFTRPFPEEAETKILSPGLAGETVILTNTSPQLPQLTADSGESNSLPRSLADYSFARNEHLVKTSLPNPDKSVAEAVAFFDALGEDNQLAIAPVLEDFFKSPDKTSLVGVSWEVRSWLESLKKLGDREFKSTSVWLSRYCYHKENALTQVNAVFAAIAEVEASKQAEAEHEIDIAKPLPSKVSSKSSHGATSTKPSYASQQFSPNELVLMLSAGLLLGVIGLFLWGSVGGILGWIIAIDSIAAGVSTVSGNTAIRSISGAVLGVIWILSFFNLGGLGFLGILWIQGFGWLTGVIVASAVINAQKQSKAESVWHPKPRRLLIVLSIVVLIGASVGLTSSFFASKKTTPQQIPQGSLTITITDTSMTFSALAIKGDAAIELINNGSKPCVLDVEVNSSGSLSITGNQIVRPGEKSNLQINATPGSYQLHCKAQPNMPSIDLKGIAIIVTP